MKLRGAINKTIKIIASVVFILVFGTSCKKKETPIPPPVSNPVVNSPYSVSTASVFSGFFASVKRTEQFSKTNILNSFSSQASFYSLPVNNPDNNTAIKINSLVYSHQFMNYDTTWKVYSSEFSSNFISELWQISGYNGIPSFNFWNNILPSCDSFNVLPDSVSKSAGFTFSLTGVVNVTTSGYEFQLYEGTNILIDLIKPIQNGNNIITITPAELANVDLSGAGLNVYIALVNIQDLNFYGSDFRFSKGNQFSKRIKIYP